MTLTMLKVRISEIRLRIASLIAGKIDKIARKHEWFYRAYGWYFKRYKFNKNYEYGAYRIVILSDKYNEEMMASVFDWQTKMLIPENLRSQIQYLKCKSHGFMKDTIGWLYSPKAVK